MRAHFALSYGGVAAGCHAGWHEIEFGGMSVLRWIQSLASLLALALGAILLCRAWREAASGSAGSLYHHVHVVAAALALIGIAWASALVLLLPTCHAM